MDQFSFPFGLRKTTAKKKRSGGRSGNEKIICFPPASLLTVAFWGYATSAQLGCRATIISFGASISEESPDSSTCVRGRQTGERSCGPSGGLHRPDFRARRRTEGDLCSRRWSIPNGHEPAAQVHVYR